MLSFHFVPRSHCNEKNSVYTFLVIVYVTSSMYRALNSEKRTIWRSCTKTSKAKKATRFFQGRFVREKNFKKTFFASNSATTCTHICLLLLHCIMYFVSCSKNDFCTSTSMYWSDFVFLRNFKVSRIFCGLCLWALVRILNNKVFFTKIY